MCDSNVPLRASTFALFQGSSADVFAPEDRHLYRERWRIPKGMRDDVIRDCLITVADILAAHWGMGVNVHIDGEKYPRFEVDPTDTLDVPGDENA